MTSSTPNVPFTFTAVDKIKEAKFFLARAQAALTSDQLDEAAKQEHARYFGSACLAAARTPINYFLDTSNPNYAARKSWYDANVSSYHAIGALRKIRNKNIHDQPTPIVNITVAMGDVPGVVSSHVLTIVDGEDNTNIMDRLINGIAETETLIGRILSECASLL